MPVGRKRVRNASGLKIKNRERGSEWRERERETERGQKDRFMKE